MLDCKVARTAVIAGALTLLLPVSTSIAQDSARLANRSRPNYRFLQDKPVNGGAAQEEEPASFELDADRITELQSIDTFNSLEDGQPGDPGHFELQFDFGWQTTSNQDDPVTFTPELKYTPDGSDFLRNMKLTLNAPMVYGLGGVDGNADVTLGWQQRWVVENGLMPTLATLAEVRLPSGYRSSGVDGTLTGIVAKEAGPGTIYLNAFAASVNGDNIEDLRHFQWGMRTGYRWRVDEKIALIADYVYQSSEQTGHSDVHLFEVSGEWHINDNLVIGPGIVVGLDHNDEAPNFGAGFRLTWAF